MNNLAKIRGQHCMTQAELAEKLGITKAGVSALENRRLTLDKAAMCAQIFNVNVFELLGTDALELVPHTKEDKDVLIRLIEGL